MANLQKKRNQKSQKRKYPRHDDCSIIVSNSLHVNFIFDIIILNMAFVYRKQKSEEVKFYGYPGPGQYNAVNQNEPTNCAVSFVDKVSRKLWEIPTTPGPGQYNSNNQNHVYEGSHVLFGQSSGFCVTDSFYNRLSGCSSNFKSKSRRLALSTKNTPGPGYYQVTGQIVKNKPKISGAWQKATKLTKYLFEETKKQKQNHEEVRQQFKQLELNQVSIGDEGIHHRHPQKKPQNHNIKSNYKSVFDSKVERNIITRPQTAVTVGPGSYNIVEKKNHSRKYFQNKMISPKNEKNREVANQLGPGYYNYDTSSIKRPKTSQSTGIQCFGSKQSRFCNKFSQVDKKTPGPQAYFKPLKQNADQNVKKDVKKPPFNTAVHKTQIFAIIKPSTLSTDVSPCSYNPRNDFNQLLKKNYIKGCIGKFGSSVERFKEHKEQFIMHQSCFNLLAGAEEQKSEKKMKKIEKIKKFSRKNQPIKKQVIFDDRPLSYDTNTKTISKKFEVKKQIDAPFLTASERFNVRQSDSQAQILDRIREQREKSILIKGKSEQQIKKPGKILKGSASTSLMEKYMNIAVKIKNMEHLIPQNSNQIQNSAIGPQTYNPNRIGKKQFNVLFQD